MIEITKTKALALLKDLADLLHILKVDGDSILQALHFEFNDFEDAIQFYTASAYKSIALILTRNTKDDKHSALPVMTPDTLLKTYIKVVGNKYNFKWRVVPNKKPVLNYIRAQLAMDFIKVHLFSSS